MPFLKRLLKAMAKRGMGMYELVSAVQRRHVGDLPAFGFFRLPRGVPRWCYQKHTISLKCRASSSDISGYHVDFHEGHGTIGELQGNGMGATWHVWISLY
jgi:hypothetical protein